MITMEPARKNGYNGWDRGNLPLDEYIARTRVLQEEMRKAGVGTLVFFSGSNYVTPGPGGGGPGATLVVDANVDPALTSPTQISGGGRAELTASFDRTQTWISEAAYGEGLPKTLRKMLDDRGLSAKPVATVGFGPAMAYRQHGDLTAALKGIDLQPFDDVVARLRAQKRLREIDVIRIARKIATDAVAAAEQKLAAGGSTTDAMVAAERSARLNKVYDVRIMANAGGDELRPLMRGSTERRTPLLMYVAAQYNGYWADASTQSAGSEAERAVQAMVAALKPGASAADLAKAGVALLPQAAVETALRYGLGDGVGLSAHEAPTISPTSTDKIAERQVIALRTYAAAPKPSLASALVLVTANGIQRL